MFDKLSKLAILDERVEQLFAHSFSVALFIYKNSIQEYQELVMAVLNDLL